jgi:large subunit ribosomal protein L30
LTYAVIRVRGTVNVRNEIQETLRMLRLNRVNHCILITESPEYKGMLQKVKDYVTWGEVNDDVLKNMIKTHGKLTGEKGITDKYINSNSDFKNISDFASSVVKGDIKYTDLKGIKPIIRLHPPRKGYEGIKRSFAAGGALGYRGKKINDLLQRML